MTIAPPGEPDIPDAVRQQWVELLDTARRRQIALDEADRLSTRCRELVVVLLRGGVRRLDLVGQPFSQSWITRIQREEGLTRRRRPTSAPTTDPRAGPTVNPTDTPAASTP